VTDAPKATAQIPASTIERAPRRWTWAWLVTIAALALGAVLVYQAWEQKGQIVLIRFNTAGGLRAGDPVAYRGIPIGEVDEVRLGTDLESIIVQATIRPDATGLIVEGSKWWIVRPEIGFRRISGLETLLGPRYVEVEPGPPGGSRTRRFEGLERSPEATPTQPDALSIVLLAPRRGSLAIGSPVHFRDIRVGAVRSFEFADDATNVRVGVDIDPEYAHLVRSRSRFWNASGIGVDWGIFGGLSVRTESLETVLGGGIGFATPNRPGDPVEQGHVFDLAADVDPDWLNWDPVLTSGEAP